MIVNTGAVIILKDRENMLEQYDTLVFNCGNVLISGELYAKATAANAMFNCGDVAVIKEPQRPVRISGLLTLGANSDHAGCYVVCDDAHITAQGVAAVESMEGMAVLDTLYHPQSVGGTFAAVRASKTTVYPDDAQLVRGDAWISAQNLSKWQKKTKYFLSGTAFALDTDALGALEAQGTSFLCEKLYMYEKDVERFGGLFVAKDMHPVPDGYAVVERSAPLMDMYATHGERIYLLGDVTVQPRDVRHLPLLQSLIVKGTAKLPLEHIQACKAVIKADKVHVFEGELIHVNGMQTISHAMLATANAIGTRYTLHVNGAVLFEDAVTHEDAQAVASLHVNGAVSAPGAVHAHLNAVTEKINGVLLGSLSEIKAMIEAMPGEAGKMFGGALPGPLAKLLGIEGEGNASVVNGGSYTLM